MICVGTVLSSREFSDPFYRYWRGRGHVSGRPSVRWEKLEIKFLVSNLLSFRKGTAVGECKIHLWVGRNASVTRQRFYCLLRQTPQPTRINNLQEAPPGRGQTKDTGNVISENCYQSALNTWNRTELRRSRKRQRNCRKTEKLGNCASQSSDNCVAALCSSVSGSNVFLWFVYLFLWHERLIKLIILFLCS